MTPTSRRVLSTLFALGLASSLTGQQFVLAQKQHLPPEDFPSTRVALGDVDGDGDLDIFLGRWNAWQSKLYLNDGRGRFIDVSSTNLPAAGGYVTDIGLADLDGDRDLDLLLADTFGRDRLWLNDGRGRFTDMTASLMPGDTGSTRCMVLGDVDGDGDLDAFLGGDTRVPDQLLINNAGRFVDMTTTNLPFEAWHSPTLAAAFTDIDKDGDLDLIACDPGVKNRVLVNDGTGRFQDQSARLPSGSGSSSVVAADFDKDGDQDLVLIEPQLLNRLFLNDGFGRFNEVLGRMPAHKDRGWYAVATDVDRDGDADLVLPSDNTRVYLNDGKGVFKDTGPARMPTENAGHVAVGDLDGNGTVDLVFTSAKTLLYFGDGTGSFVSGNGRRFPYLFADEAVASAVGDFDRDGDVDVAIARGGTDLPAAKTNRLYVNDGFGRFSEATSSTLPASFAASRDIAAVDVDNDGDLDLVVANVPYGFPITVGGQNDLYLNDGSGRFQLATSGRLPFDDQASAAVVFGDIDNDGDGDLLFANTAVSTRAVTNRLLVNDGRGVFTDVSSRLPAHADRSNDAAFADVDGDRDLDVLIANDGANRLYLNDGRGFFADASAQLPASSANTTAVCAADVDGDGDIDIVFANSSAADVLYLNDGRGNFTDVTATQLPNAAAYTPAAALVDIDGDGDPDLVAAVSTASTSQYRIHVNDGRGFFRDATAVRSDPSASAGVGIAFADVDGDGDLDFLSAAGHVDLFLNRLRQIASDQVLRLSVPYQIDAWAHPGFATGPQLALVHLNLAAQNPALLIPPFGRWQVSIAGMIPLPPVFLPAATGTGSVTLRFPQLAALVGQDLYAQAWIAHSAQVSTWRFSNTLVERIYP